MVKMLDLRGFSCPIPLIRTKEALADAGKVTVVVDEAAAKENVTKFARSQGCQVECTSAGGEHTLVITKP